MLQLLYLRIEKENMLEIFQERSPESALEKNQLVRR